jgi:hypothetical protein
VPGTNAWLLVCRQPRAYQNRALIAVHRRRFFFTPTGTCANPTPRVKIFLVSSDTAHSHRHAQKKRGAIRPALVGARYPPRRMPGKHARRDLVIDPMWSAGARSRSERAPRSTVSRAWEISVRACPDVLLTFTTRSIAPAPPLPPTVATPRHLSGFTYESGRPAPRRPTYNPPH